MIHISKVNEIVKGTIYGDNDLYVKGPCNIQVGKKDYLSYIKNENYLKYLQNTLASVIIIDEKVNIPRENNQKTFLKVDNAALAFIKFLNFYDNINNVNAINHSICKSAKIHDTANIGENVFIGSNVVIGESVTIGDNVIIKSNSSIENKSIIGENSIIDSDVVIYRSTNIGKNCKIKAGSIIGGLGFGLITDDKGKHHRIPHVGNVEIGNNVFIGSNCTIDRGTIDNTIISDGTNLDNQVHVGHNVNIGSDCLICAQVGIAGSTKIYNNVIIGGQAGIIDNLIIQDNVIIGPRSFVVKSINKNLYVSGNPARNHKDHVKQDILITKLPEIYKKIFNK